MPVIVKKAVTTPTATLKMTARQVQLHLPVQFDNDINFTSNTVYAILLGQVTRQTYIGGGIIFL